MCNRVGGKSRKSRELRKIEVAQAVASGTSSGKGFATLRDVASTVGLTASTHLLDILNELRLEKAVDRELSEDEQGRSYYRWTKLSANVSRPKNAETVTLPRYYIRNKDDSLCVIWLDVGGIVVSDNFPWAYPFLTSDLGFARKIANLLSVRVDDKKEIMQVSVYPEFPEVTE